MKRIFILIATALAAVACNSGDIKLDGRLIGCDTTMVYIESLGSSLGGKIIDSVRTDANGKFNIKIKAENEQMSLYNLNCNGQRIPLLLAKGDAVTINSVGSLARNYEVSGSEESALLKQVTFLMLDGAARLDSLSTCFAGLTDEKIDSYVTKYLKENTAESFSVKRLLPMLLALVDETSSVREACSRMQISYSTGWNMIRRLEDQIRDPLILRPDYAIMNPPFLYSFKKRR